MTMISPKVAMRASPSNVIQTTTKMTMRPVTTNQRIQTLRIC
jgi:hypothetical protein